LYERGFFFQKDEGESEKWNKLAKKRQYYCALSHGQGVGNFILPDEELPSQPIFFEISCLEGNAQYPFVTRYGLSQAFAKYSFDDGQDHHLEFEAGDIFYVFNFKEGNGMIVNKLLKRKGGDEVLFQLIILTWQSK
jgi:hypothetical protein